MQATIKFEKCKLENDKQYAVIEIDGLTFRMSCIDYEMNKAYIIQKMQKIVTHINKAENVII